MGADTNTPGFFVAGGTLRPDTPSYVKRPADDELFNLALAGEYCYVLTPRQMGKSSLMIRTARRLQQNGIYTAIIDLTRIGTDVTVEQWYHSLVNQLKRRLQLSIDPVAWWEERAALGAVDRLTEFLREVVLTNVQGQVIVFIDEIDTTLSLGFRDDFFAAIRAMYNARADDPAFNRLSFVLLGVASPPELIKDPARTPFNIGTGIALQEFSQADAIVLRDGLETARPGQGDALFRRVFHWTNGHPYLTQKLCLAIAEAGDRRWTDERVDELVERAFLSEEGRKEANLKFVQDKTLTHPRRQELVRLYDRILAGKAISDDGQSPVQNQLKLSGLVKAEDGALHVRNEIYYRVFNRDWVKSNTPVDWIRRIAVIMALAALVLAAALAVYTWRQGQQPADVLARDYENRFNSTTNPTLRLEYLARLFDLEGYSDRARVLFNGLTLDEKIALFASPAPDLQPQVRKVVTETYTILSDTQDNNRVLGAMQSALSQFPEPESRMLAIEIARWLDGRAFFADGNNESARISYGSAIDLNQQNPATHFERALILAAMQDYEAALADFETAASLDERRQENVRQAILDNSALYNAYMRKRETYQTLAVFVPTPTSTNTSTTTSTSSPTPTSSPTGSLTPTYTPTDTPTNTPTPTTTPSPTPTVVPTPSPTEVTPTPPYAPPVLAPVSIIGCNVTFRWAWSGTLDVNEWFAVRVGRQRIEQLHTVASTKNYSHIYPLSDAGNYVWEIVICQGEPSYGICEQLADSEQATFYFGGCPVSPLTPTEPSMTPSPEPTTYPLIIEHEAFDRSSLVLTLILGIAYLVPIVCKKN